MSEYRISIVRGDNGYLLEYEDENEDGSPRTIFEVIQDGPDNQALTGALKSGEELLWWVMDYFGFGGSKHDAERIRIVRVKREEEE